MNLSKIVATIALSYTPFIFSQFSQAPLPYSYHAFEDVIDSKTMEIHYTKHAAGYVNNLNKAILGTPYEKKSLKDILANVSKLPPAIRNNAGGHYNHELFWKILTPEKNTMPTEKLSKAIQEQFGSMDALKDQMNKAASERFGSGWAWLVVGKDKKLKVSHTPNQDNPMMDIAEIQGTPILGIDVWEHAYYLKYQNKRNDYLAAIWKIINWNEVSKRYDEATKGRFDDWPEIKDFHKVMSQTFHPSEEGNLEPIRTRIGEMLEKAKALQNSKIPAEFNKKGVAESISTLVKYSQKLQKDIKKKAKDDHVVKSLKELHDVFHTIVGLCTVEENHDH